LQRGRNDIFIENKLEGEKLFKISRFKKVIKGTSPQDFQNLPVRRRRISDPGRSNNTKILSNYTKLLSFHERNSQSEAEGTRALARSAHR
jgi:hypothetical protein